STIDTHRGCLNVVVDSSLAGSYVTTLALGTAIGIILYASTFISPGPWAAKCTVSAARITRHGHARQPCPDGDRYLIHLITGEGTVHPRSTGTQPGHKSPAKPEHK